MPCETVEFDKSHLPLGIALFLVILPPMHLLNDPERLFSGKTGLGLSQRRVQQAGQERKKEGQCTPPPRPR